MSDDHIAHFENGTQSFSCHLERHNYQRAQVFLSWQERSEMSQSTLTLLSVSCWIRGCGNATWQPKQTGDLCSHHSEWLSWKDLL